MARSHYIPGSMRVEEIEAMEMHKALSWIKNSGYLQMIFRADNNLVVDAMSRNEIDRSEFGQYMKDCENLFRSISLFRIKYIVRDINVVAHVITHKAMGFLILYV